jgi:recombination protein RecA
VRVKVVKNKVAPPFRRVELDIMFGKGISASGSLLDAAVKYEIIDKKGAWYAYNEEKVGQGRDNAKIYLEEHPDFAREVDAKVRKVMFPGREAPTEAVPPPHAAQESASSAKSAAVVSSELPEDAPPPEASDENFDSAASEPVAKRSVGRPRKTPVELVQALSEEE